MILFFIGVIPSKAAVVAAASRDLHCVHYAAMSFRKTADPSTPRPPAPENTGLENPAGATLRMTPLTFHAHSVRAILEACITKLA
jgi:hypothetical protein